MDDVKLVELVSLMVGGTGVLGLFITLITLPATRRKTKAETENLIAATEQIRIEAQHNLQEQLDELREQNKRLFVEREHEREAKEKLRAELNRVHEEQTLLRQELQAERIGKLKLTEDLEAQKKVSLDKVLMIDELQKQLEEQKKQIDTHGNEIAMIKHVTGQLPDRFGQR